MAKKKNSLLRTVVPLALILLGIGVVAAVAVNSTNQRGRPTAPTPAELAAEQGEPAVADGGAVDPGEIAPVPTGAAPGGAVARMQEGGEVPVPETASAGGDPELSAPVAPERVVQEPAAPESSAAAAQAAPPSAPPAGPAVVSAFRPRLFEDIPDPAPIGSLEGENGQILYVEFSPFGAGVRSLRLGTDFFEAVDSDEHVELQSQRSVQRPGRSDLTAVPLAALAISVDDGPSLSLAAPGVWRPIEGEAGAFEAIIEDAAGDPALRLERRYELLPGTFRLVLTRRVENLTGRDLTVRWQDAGPIDLPEPTMGYGGDKRRVRFGYLLDPRNQAGSMAVTADHELTGRHRVLGDREPDASGFKRYTFERPMWPTPETLNKNHRLVWTAFTGRYFTVALHPLYDPASVTPGGEEKIFSQVEMIDRLVLNPYAERDQDAVMLMRVTTAPKSVPAGGSASSQMGIYAGPLLRENIVGDPLLESLNLQGLIIYNFGGFCGTTCTFDWMTHVLLWVLRAAHSVTGDWALAIIILVLIVRTALHPITRWSQIRLQLFGKQMQEMAPKQQKLREKYKDDPKKMQAEMARLWQEEGVNPAGALGCLPLFLQSPVWIALYATLYFAAEMRHEPAFWGVFQAISGGNWRFLDDLSSPDRALPLPSFLHFTPPFIGKVYGEVTSINLLPILMGVLFYVHQKFLSPPPSASMTPEQEQQQKIIRIMFPLMMPVFMYPAPSGLLVYFITNSALAIVENKHIRASAEKKGLLDIERIKAEKAARRQAKGEGGGGGFLARLQALAEERQQQMQAQQGKKRVQNTARPARPEPKPRNYKKRK